MFTSTCNTHNRILRRDIFAWIHFRHKASLLRFRMHLSMHFQGISTDFYIFLPVFIDFFVKNADLAKNVQRKIYKFPVSTMNRTHEGALERRGWAGTD